MTKGKWRLSEDQIVALIIVVISLAYLMGARSLGSLRSDDAVGPAGFPILIAVGSLVLGMCLWLKHAIEEEQESLGGPVWLYWLVFLGYAFAIHHVGFALSTAAFLTVTFLILKVPLWRSVLVAVIASGALWGVFVKFLDVRLPFGFWS